MGNAFFCAFSTALYQVSTAVSVSSVLFLSRFKVGSSELIVCLYSSQFALFVFRCFGQGITIGVVEMVNIRNWKVVTACE